MPMPMRSDKAQDARLEVCRQVFAARRSLRISVSMHKPFQFFVGTHGEGLKHESAKIYTTVERVADGVGIYLTEAFTIGLEGVEDPDGRIRRECEEIVAWVSNTLRANPELPGAFTKDFTPSAS